MATTNPMNDNDIAEQAIASLRRASQQAHKTGQTQVVLKGQQLVEIKNGKIVKVLKENVPGRTRVSVRTKYKST